MADIPSLSSGGVNSRFVSETEIDAINKRREEQWKAAYARLGQDTPEQPQEDVYDGRSLAEKLAANKIAQQEEWENKMKLSNQFRSLEEDEVLFLDTLREKQLEEERKRRQEDGEEVKNFKQAVAARNYEISSSASTETQTKAPLPPGKPKPIAPKRDNKKLKGVVVKRKSTSTKEIPSTTSSSKSQTEDDTPNAKRQKIE